jgi:Na+/proline symporter
MKTLALLLLVPLAVWAAGGMHHAIASMPPGFLRVTNGPYNWLYLVGWAVMLTITLNGSWSLAQKFYSVKNEREASKAAYFSAFLHLIGGPVMILPAILARTFLPDLIAQHKTADVYMLLVLKLLPAGMVGIIVAAMLSATMATVSSDFSAIASVLTKDVYQRLIRPDATEKRMVNIGRGITLLVGGTSLGIGLYIARGGDQSLFHLMVLLASAFIAPSFVPLMAALVSKKLNWQGVVVGYFLGLTTGLTLLGMRSWYFPRGHWPWMAQNYDGAAVLINTAVTILGMALGTKLFGSKRSEETKYEQIFTHVGVVSAYGAGQRLEQAKVIAYASAAVGVLLSIAGLLAASRGARIIDLVVGAALIALGSYRVSRSKRLAAAEERALKRVHAG